MRNFKKFAKKSFILMIAVIFWILIWHFYARKVDSSIFLPTPKETLKALLVLVKEKIFWKIVYTSFQRILKGFILATLAGIILATISAFCTMIKILVEPFMKLVKSVPVASFTILILLWINSENLSAVISFFMVLSVIYINVLQGFENVSKDMLEMAKVYKISFAKKIRFLYLPSVYPAFIAACRVGIGLCFKSGIAAEVIGLPAGSIGSELYKAKLYLMTEELFAWTIVIILMSVLLENVCIYILNIISRRMERVGAWSIRFIKTDEQAKDEKADKSAKVDKADKINKAVNNDKSVKAGKSVKVDKSVKAGKLVKVDKPVKKDKSAKAGKSIKQYCVNVKNISKFYEGNCVFKDISFKVRNGEVFCVTGESGIGKTTLMKIIMGIVKPDAGQVMIGDKERKLTAVFQEDRLLKNADIYTNLYFAMQDDKNFNEKIPVIDMHLKQAGLEGLGRKKTEELSGGMRRRVAIIRAVITNPDILILDEAFNGLDDNTKDIMIEYIKTYCCDKIVMMVTHNMEEAKKMGANIFRLENHEMAESSVRYETFG